MISKAAFSKPMVLADGAFLVDAARSSGSSSVSSNPSGSKLSVLAESLTAFWAFGPACAIALVVRIDSKNAVRTIRFNNLTSLRQPDDLDYRDSWLCVRATHHADAFSDKVDKSEVLSS